ncbi:MAG: hypothetical protein K6E24_05430 [bacterium]|nr:hypothetical protein [bacterium]
MKNSIKIKKMVGIATLASLVIGLQFLSNYVTFGSVSITLALIPIAVGAILYGPIVGMILGVIMGLVVIVAPSTLTYFMPVNPAATVILCLLKTGLAGLISGLIFKLFAFVAKKKEKKSTKNTLFAFGIIIAGLVIPIINTGLFIVGASIFFTEIYGSAMAVIEAVIATNFFIEFGVSVVLSPVLVYLIKALTYQTDLGFTSDFSSFNEEKSNQFDEYEEAEIKEEKLEA